MFAAQEHKPHAILLNAFADLLEDVYVSPTSPESELFRSDIADDDDIVSLGIEVEEFFGTRSDISLGLTDHLVHIEPFLASQDIAEPRFLPAQPIDDQ